MADTGSTCHTQIWMIRQMKRLVHTSQLQISCHLIQTEIHTKREFQLYIMTLKL